MRAKWSFVILEAETHRGGGQTTKTPERERRIDVQMLVCFPDLELRARALKNSSTQGGRSTALFCVLGDAAYEMIQSYQSTSHYHVGVQIGKPRTLFWIAVFAQVVVLSRFSLTEHGTISAPF